MLLQDLGPAARDATDQEGAALAVRVHQVGDTGGLPTLDGPRLAALPRRMIDQFGRLGIAGAALKIARVLDKLAPERSEGSTMEPVRAGAARKPRSVTRVNQPAARCALGWHHIWAADRFTHQLAIGWTNGAEVVWAMVIGRQLTEAARLMNG